LSTAVKLPNLLVRLRTSMRVPGLVSCVMWSH
jgi:hypothetical protein